MERVRRDSIAVALRLAFCARGRDSREVHCLCNRVREANLIYIMVSLAGNIAIVEVVWFDGARKCIARHSAH